MVEGSVLSGGAAAALSDGGSAEDVSCCSPVPPEQPVKDSIQAHRQAVIINLFIKNHLSLIKNYNESIAAVISPQRSSSLALPKIV